MTTNFSNLCRELWKTSLRRLPKSIEANSKDLFIVGSPSVVSVGRLLTRWALGSQWAISAHQLPTASDTPLKVGPLVSSSRAEDPIRNTDDTTVCKRIYIRKLSYVYELHAKNLFRYLESSTDPGPQNTYWVVFRKYVKLVRAIAAAVFTDFHRIWYDTFLAAIA